MNDYIALLVAFALAMSPGAFAGEKPNRGLPQLALAAPMAKVSPQPENHAPEPRITKIVIRAPGAPAPAVPETPAILEKMEDAQPVAKTESLPAKLEDKAAVETDAAQEAQAEADRNLIAEMVEMERKLNEAREAMLLERKALETERRRAEVGRIVARMGDSSCINDFDTGCNASSTAFEEAQ